MGLPDPEFLDTPRDPPLDASAIAWPHGFAFLDMTDPHSRLERPPGDRGARNP